MKKSSLQIILMVVIVGIIAEILLVAAINAGNFSVKKMPVEITIRIDGNKITETNAKEITIKAFKGQKIEIDFKARIVNCKSCLDIIAIKDKEIYLLLSTTGGNEQDSGCIVSGTEILIPEENIEYFNFVFLSSGKDKYGAGVGDKTIQELLKDWKDLKSKTVDTMIVSIRGNTVDSDASDDSMAIKEIKVEIEEAPSIEIKHIEWILEWPHEKIVGIKFYGTSNLPEDTLFDCAFIGSFGETIITKEVSYDGKIEFSIDIDEKIDAGEYFLKFYVDKFGWSSEEISITIDPIQPTPAPTTKKFNGHPVSRSALPEILESTTTPISKPWPTPTTIPGIEEPETPGMSGIASILAIIIAITFFKKRKK